MSASRRTLFTITLVAFLIVTGVHAQEAPPVEAPTITPLPTEVPTEVAPPTDVPTTIPTETLTLAPEPSLTPLPTDLPTQTLTPEPSLTAVPTVLPSATPSVTPSIMAAATSTASLTPSLTLVNVPDTQNHVSVQAVCTPSASLSAIALVSGSQFSSAYTSLSADGASIVFQSNDSSLVLNDTNSATDIFVYNRQTCTITRVSVAANSTQANGHSTLPSVSGNGRYVAFISEASNLTGGDTNNRPDVFVKDLQTGAVTRIQTNQSAGSVIVGRPSLSSDGRYAVYQRYESTLSSGSMVESYDFQTSTAQTIGEGSSPTLSSNGLFVTFLSLNALVASDTNGQWDVYLFSRASSQLERISISALGAQNNNGSLNFAPSISDNSRYVVFQSSASNLVSGDTNNATDIFLRDRQTSQTTRISLNSDEQEANGSSTNPHVSGDGRYVTFSSAASNLVSGDTNNAADIFVRDVQVGVTYRIPGSGVGNGSADFPAISNDGNYLAFQSGASDLVSGDTNSAQDVFVAQRLSFAPPIIPPTMPGGCEDHCGTPVTPTPSYTSTRTLVPSATLSPTVAGTQTLLPSSTPSPFVAHSPRIFSPAQGVGITASASGGVTPYTFSLVSTPTYGTLSGTLPNVTYVPSSGYVGIDQFVYKVTDQAGKTANGTVTLSTYPVLTATDRTVNTPFETASTITLAAVGGAQPYTFEIVANPTAGTLSGTLPNLIYTPTAGYSGSDSFTFKVTDTYGFSDTGVVSIIIAPKLVFANQTVAAAYERSLAIQLSPTGGIAPYTYTVGSPSHGTVTGTAPALVYTPPNGYSGYDAFNVTVTDAIGKSVTATISITIPTPFMVAAGNTAALINAIVAANISQLPDTIILGGGTYTLTTRYNSDVESPDGLPVLSGVLYIRGNSSVITRSTAPNTPLFRILSTDGDISIENLTLSGGNANTKTGGGSTYSTYGGGIHNDGKLNLNNVTITNNSAFFGAAIANTVNGSIVLTNSVVRDNIAANWYGIENMGQFTATNIILVNNGPGGGISTGNIYGPDARATITNSCITGNPNPAINRGTLTASVDARYNWWGSSTGPSLFDDLLQVGDAIDTSAVDTYGFLTAGILGCPTAQDKQLHTPNGRPIAMTFTGSGGVAPYTFSIATGPTNGTLTGSPPNVTYTPNAGFSGTEKFTFRLVDSQGLPATGLMTIDVAPELVATTQNINTPLNTAVLVTLAASGGKAPYVFSNVSTPANGSITGTLPNITYTPNAGFTGSNSFTFRVTDADGIAKTGTINVVVGTLVAQNQNLNTAFDTQVAITLSSTGGAAPFSYSIVNNPANGVLSGAPPTITYLPTHPFTGTDTFVFKVTDRLGTTSNGTVTINVGAPPTVTISVNTTAQEVPPVTNGNCTLIEAMLAANSNAAVDGCAAGSTGEDIINVPAGTYTFSTPYRTDAGGKRYALPTISSSITIFGAGIDKTILQRAANTNNFVIFYNNSTLTLQGLTVGNSQKPMSASSNNPAVSNTNKLTVIASKFVYNASDSGSAIRNESVGSIVPVAVIRDSVFLNNSSYNRGGAIYNLEANLTVTNSVFLGNNGFDHTAPVQGGTSIWSMGTAVVQNNCFLDAAVAVVHYTNPSYPNPMNATNNWWGDSGTASSTTGSVNVSPTLAVRPAICDLAAPPKLDVAAGDVAGLIAAIEYANTQTTPITINLAPNSTYTLTQIFPTGALDTTNKMGLPVIMAKLTINGNGSTITRSTAAGTPDFRIITATNSELNLVNLTISNGRAYWGAGIGLYGGMKLSLNTVKVLNNYADEGAGIGGSYEVNITNSHFEGNTSTSQGGAIRISSGDPIVSITNSTFFNNHGSNGSSIYAYSTQNVSITNNCFVNNEGLSVSNYIYNSSILNMPNNWWGSSSGPSISVNGEGDTISTNIAYTPFLTTKPARCPTVPLTAESQSWLMLFRETEAYLTLSADGGIPAYTYSIVSNPTHGTLTLAFPDVIYRPNVGYIGTDSFTYKVTDTVGATATATVTMTIQDANIHVTSFNQEQPFVVNGNCTLGEAITAANTNTAVDGCEAGIAYDVINLPFGTYTFTQPDNTNAADGPSALPIITSNIAINGNGSILQRSTAAGTPDFRLFNAASGSLDLYEMTVKNGRLVRQNYDTDRGGNIYSKAPLYLTEVTVTNGKTSSNAGGIYVLNPDAIFVVEDSLISGNDGPLGGGIYACADTTILNSEISNNIGQTGGGIGVGCGTAYITGSVISQNSSTDIGGGIYVNNVNTTIVDSVLSNNVSVKGSEVYSDNVGIQKLTIENSCVMDRSNSAVYDKAWYGTIIATNNWWGSASGPGGIGSGTGAIIEGQGVIYSPFRTAPIWGCGVLSVVGVNQSINLANGAAKAVTVKGQDGAPPYTYSMFSQPMHGTLSGVLPNVTYTASAGYSGTDWFRFNVTDANGVTALGLVEFAIAPVLAPPNRTLNVLYQTSGSLTLNTIGGRAPYSYAITAPPAHGSVSGVLPVVTYTPAQGYSGGDVITYRVTDANGTTATATIQITVGAILTTANQDLLVLADTSLPISLSAQGGTSPYTFVVLVPPEHGSVYGTNGLLTYVPASGYTGYDSIQYKVTDGLSQTATGTVSIKVVSSLTIGEYQENSFLMSYSGNWIDYTGTGPVNGSFKYTNDPNAKAVFWVDESVGRVILRRTTYSNYGSTAIYVDGSSTPLTTMNNASSTLLFGVPFTFTIPTGSHKIELRNVGNAYSSVDQIDLLPPLEPLKASVGTYQESESNLSYVGNWINIANAGALGGTRRYTSDPTARVSFNIDSSVGQVTIYRTVFGSTFGTMQVYVDGVLHGTIVNNTSSTVQYGVPYTFSVIPGSHTIELRNTGSKFSDIDQIKVEAPTAPLTTAIGTYQESHSGLTYVGNWVSIANAGALGGTRRYTSDPTARVSFNIDSSVGQVTIYRTVAGSTFGTMQVYVDGVLHGTIANNTSSTIQYGVPYTFMVTPGNHVIELRNVSSKFSDIDQITVAGS
ncbi:MAG: tandem-95 repeat protein [Chloroflexi bacterium]|nr:tandem-95 repeat protein [Chloroflexota bacterium]MCC6891968.1 tandem-95 repeat protein [Anaerolineae bacterium]